MNFDLNQLTGPLALLVAVVQLFHQMRQTRLMETQAEGTAIAITGWWPAAVKISKTPGFFALSLLVILAWTPRILDYYFPPENFQLTDYGVGPSFVFHGKMPSQSLSRYRENYRMMLMVRMQYGNIDRMRDHAVEKSITYTIDGPLIAMYAPGQINPLKLRINFDHPSVNIEYDAVLVPTSVTPDDITTLADVAKFGGRILDARLQTIATTDLGIRPANAPPLAAPCVPPTNQ